MSHGGGLCESQTFADGEDAAFGYGHVVGVPPREVDADVAKVHTGVVESGEAGLASPAGNRRLDHDALTRDEIVDPGTEAHDDPGRVDSHHMR